MILNKKAKVLFLMQLPPPTHGASLMNQYVINSNLIQANFDCIILPFRFVKNISEIRKFTFTKVWIMLVTFLKLFKILISKNPSLVYFTVSPIGGSFYRDFTYLMLLKIFNKKILIHLHGKGIKKYIGDSKLKKLIYKIAFSKTYVICLADVLKEDISDFNPCRIFTLSNGIPVIQNKVSRAKSEENRVKFLYLSSLHISKGIIVLLDAVKQLQEAGYTIFNLKIVGNSTPTLSLDKLQQKINERGINNFVTVLGPKYNDEKWTQLSSSDIFILPTMKDCFPISILEALQFGLPVISTDEGAIPEMVIDGKTGFLIEQNNPKALAKTMAFFLENRNQISIMSDNAIQNFSKDYRIETFEKRLSSIISKCIHSI